MSGSISDTGRRRSTIFDVAPEWITVREAAYAAHVSEDLIVEWAQAGRIGHRSLLPGGGSLSLLLRTADIRGCIDEGSRAGGAIALPSSWSFEARLPTEPRWQVSRRKVLVGLGAAVAGAVVPVHAFAGGGPHLPSATDILDPLTITAGHAHHHKTADAGGALRPGGGGGKHPAIRSVIVEPDPVRSGGSAAITIDATPRHRIVTYTLSSSEGVLQQDPRSPWLWTWSDR